MVIFGDDLLSDDEDDELKEGQKPIEVELNTHFDTSRGKSKLIKKESNISFYEKPEKHEKFRLSQEIEVLNLKKL